MQFGLYCLCAVLLPVSASSTLETASRGPIPALPPGHKWRLTPAVIPVDVLTMWTDSEGNLFYAGRLLAVGGPFIGNASEAGLAAQHTPLGSMPYSCDLLVSTSSGFACAIGSMVSVYDWMALGAWTQPFWKVRLPSRIRAMEFLEDGDLAVSVDSLGVQLFRLTSPPPWEAFQELVVGIRVIALVKLQGVGLVVCSPDSIQLFNASSLQSKGPKQPYLKLTATDEVFMSIVALDHWGLAVVGVNSNHTGLAIRLFNSSSLQPQARQPEPYQVIHLSWVLHWGSLPLILASFSGGTLAVSSENTVFFGAESLRPGGPTKPLQTQDAYFTLAPLGNGRFAAGGTDKYIYLYNAGGDLEVILSASKEVSTVLDIEGGLMAATASEVLLYNLSNLQRFEMTKPFQLLDKTFWHQMNQIRAACILGGADKLAIETDPLWFPLYNESSLQPHGPTLNSGNLLEGPFQPSRYLPTLLPLPRGLAMGTPQEEGPAGRIQLFDSSGSPFQELNGPLCRSTFPWPLLLLLMEGQLLAAGDNEVHVFSPSSLQAGGPKSPVQELEIKSAEFITDMVALPSGGLAVSVWQEQDKQLSILLFGAASLQSGGPPRPFQSLWVASSSGSRSGKLVASESGGLVVDIAGALHFFNRSSMLPGGPQEPFKSLPLDFDFEPVIFLHRDASGLPSWFRGSDVLQPASCPASTFKLDEVTCHPCPSDLLSLAGSDQCDLLPGHIVIKGLLLAGALLAVTACSVGALSWLFRERQLPRRVLPLVCSWLLGSAVLAAGTQRQEWFWWWAGLVLLASRGLLALPSPGNRKVRQGVMADLAILGTFIVLASVLSVQLTNDMPSWASAVGMWTPLGRAHWKLQQSTAGLAFILPVMETVWAWYTIREQASASVSASPVILEPQQETHKGSLVEALAESEPPLRTVARPSHPCFGSTPRQFDTGTGHRRIWTRTRACRDMLLVHQWLRGSRPVVWSCMLLRFCCTWEGRHLGILTNCLVSLCTLGAKLATYQVSAAGEGTLIVAVVLSGLGLAHSLITLLWASRAGSRALDPHFRRGLLLKGLLLMSKAALVAIPEAFEPVEVAFAWSCTQDLCPDWCTERSGRCILQGDVQTGRGSCTCESSWPCKAVTALTAASCCVMGGLTVLDLASFCRLHDQGRVPKRLVAGAVLCNVAQLSGLGLVFLLPLTALSGHPGPAGIFALSLIPLSLAVNEFKWLRPPTEDMPSIQLHDSGLIIYVTLTIVMAAVGLFWLCDHIAAELAQPLYAVPSFSQHQWLLYLGTFPMAVAMLASPLLLCQQSINGQ